MIIIDFWIGKTKYTWFIDNNYLGIFAFLISLAGGFIYKIYKRRKTRRLKLKKDIKKMPRGGSHLSDCIDPSSAYEVVNEDFKKIIYHILGLNENIPVVVPITAPIVFIAKAILSRQIGTQLSILGVRTVVTNAKDVGVKVTIGALAGLAVAVFANPAAFIGGGLVVAAFGLNIYFGDIKCDNFVSKLDVLQTRLNSGKSPYLELPPGKKNLVVMPAHDEHDEEKAIALYVEESQPLERCSEELESSGSVRRKCYTEKKYVPLKQRTKTLADLKRDDSTEVRDQARPDIERYKKKNEKQRAQRISNSEKEEL